MKSTHLLGAAVLLAPLLIAPPAFAQGNAAVASDELREGSALRKAGKFAEAFPHLAESFRLDPQARSALNLADCEEHIGKLVNAEKHWIAARDRGAGEGNEPARAEAQRRLSLLEARLPKLSIRGAAALPQGTEVLWDGTPLGAVALGSPVPADPGTHPLVVRAAGHQDLRYEVGLTEGQVTSVDVTVGPSMRPVLVAEPVETGGHSSRRTIGFVIGGVGIVGIGIGSYLALHAISLHGDSNDACTPGCTQNGASLNNQAITYANLANVGFGVGLVGLAVGTYLVVTSPSRSTTVAPIVGPHLAGLGWRQTW
jgi:hypothetical protein